MFLPDQDSIKNLNLEQTFNWRFFIYIYIFSFLPVYGGAITMLIRLGRNVSFKSIVLFVKSFFKNNFSSNLKDPIFLIGLIVFLFGWFLPYVYIFLNYKMDFLYKIIILAIICLFILVIKRKKRKKIEVSSYKIQIIKNITDHEETEKLWAIYDESFKQINEKSPCRQSFHKDDFIKILGKDNVLKILAYVNKKPIALAMVSNDFANSPWISEDYYRVNFPTEYSERRIYYFMGIVIEKQYRNLGMTVEMLKKLVQKLPKNVIIGFDHSFKNNSRIAKFPYLLGRQFIKRKYLDSMDYYIAYFNR